VAPPRDAEVARVERAAAALGLLARGRLDACVVLGSGIEGPPLEAEQRVPMDSIPALRVPSVAGHAGEVRVGLSHGLRTVVFGGRVHLYEGASRAEAVRPVRAAARAGAKVAILTNASGGIAPSLKPGTLLVVTDHIDLGRGDPAEGDETEAFGPRFTSMAGAYDGVLRRAAGDAARRARVPWDSGVYAFVRGPAFETAAEVRMLRRLGADAVGMSTVPEAIAARRLGMRLFALSVVANAAGGPGDSHASVLRRVRSRAAAVARVLDAVLAAAAGPPA